MLTKEQLYELYERLGLSQAARTVIEQIRSSPPSRRVQSGKGNVYAFYPSRKMGVTIQAESHKNELAGIYEKEHDPDVLEYYDQPSPIQLVYPSKSGRQVKVMHTPDFFVLGTDGVGWEEWKLEEELRELRERMPHRYGKDDQEQWRCPPGEKHAQALDLFYRVRSSAEIDWIFQRNLRFLEDYLREDCYEISPAVQTNTISWVQAQPGLSLDELLGSIGEINSDSLYRLIALGEIYCDLWDAPLAEAKRVRVYLNEETAAAYALMAGTTKSAWFPATPTVTVAVGATLIWDNQPWQIVNLGETKTWLQGMDDTLIELAHPTIEKLVKQGQISGTTEQPVSGVSEQAQAILMGASPRDLQEANRRYRIIEAQLKGQASYVTGVPARTQRAWKARYRQAKQAWGCGYVGLIPQQPKRGNRQSKLPTETLLLLEQFIEERYETLKQKSRRAVYGELVRSCQDKGLVVPSFPTFCQRVKQRPRYQQLKQRQGVRAAYAYEPLYLELHLTTPRHGDRPFEICHIDHTQLDIELICSMTYRNLGRPWVTFLVDAFSRRLLALYLTFDSPSYRSGMMVLRECVRRHARLPQVVVVDGGAEFASTYFETLLARYECTKKTRPGAKPRFGSVCERLFGTTNTTFIHNLWGNTQMMTNVRQVTKAVNPRQQAQWTLETLYLHLYQWAYEVYDTLDHPALGQSPRAAFAQGLSQSGWRLHRLIPFDDHFRMLTLPTTAKGSAKVQPNIGVKINYIYYWADAFRNAKIENRPVAVRYDPFDIGLVYASVNGRWVQCVSEYYAIFKGRSERELLLATAELRQRHKQHNRKFTLNARRLAKFLDSLEAEELLLQQRLRDAASQAVRGLDQPGQTEPQESSQTWIEPDPIVAAPLVKEIDHNDPQPLTTYGDF